MQRKRENDNTSHLSFTQFHTDIDCVDSQTDYPDAVLVGSKESMIDNVTKSYYARSKRGEVIVNPMSQVKNTWQSAEVRPGDQHWKNQTYAPCLRHWGDGRVWSQWSGAHSITEHLHHDINVATLVTLAGTEAQAGVNAAEFQGLTFVAELKQGIKQFKNPVRQFEKVVRSARSRARIRAKKRPYRKGYTLYDYIQENWLQYRYGIMPLVHDLESAVEAVESLAHKRLRHTSRGDAAQGSVKTGLNTFDHGYWKQTCDITTRTEISVRAGCIYQADTRNTFGLAMADVPSTLWEIVPASFVLDWFANIGDYLAAITPKIGVDVLGSWTTIQIDSDTLWSFDSEQVDESSWIWSSLPASTYQRTTSNKTRSRGTQTGLVAKPIPFEGDLGTKRITDTIAIVNGLLRGKL